MDSPILHDNDDRRRSPAYTSTTQDMIVQHSAPDKGPVQHSAPDKGPRPDGRVDTSQDHGWSRQMAQALIKLNYVKGIVNKTPLKSNRLRLLTGRQRFSSASLGAVPGGALPPGACCAAHTAVSRHSLPPQWSAAAPLAAVAAER